MTQILEMVMAALSVILMGAFIGFLIVIAFVLWLLFSKAGWEQDDDKHEINKYDHWNT